MYKLTKMHLVVIAAIAVAMALVGCSGSSSNGGDDPGPGPSPSPTDVTGEWMYQGAVATALTAQDGSELVRPAYVNIKGDGTYRFEESHDTYEEGTWTTQNDQITFTVTGGSGSPTAGDSVTLTYQLSGNNLVMTENGVRHTFVALADTIPSALADRWLSNQTSSGAIYGVDISSDGSYTGTEAIPSIIEPLAAPAQADELDIYWQQGTMRASVENDLLVMPRTFSGTENETPHFPLEYQWADDDQNRLQITTPGINVSQLPTSLELDRKVDIPSNMQDIWMLVQAQENGTVQKRFSYAWMILTVLSTGEIHRDGYETPDGSKIEEQMQTEMYTGNRLAVLHDSGTVSNIPVEAVNIAVSGDTMTVTGGPAGDSFTETYKREVDAPAGLIDTWQLTNAQETTETLGLAQAPDMTLQIQSGGVYTVTEGTTVQETGNAVCFADEYLNIVPSGGADTDMRTQWFDYDLDGDTLTVTSWYKDSGNYVTETMTFARQ